MITLAALLAAALPALSQAQLQNPSVSVYEHPDVAARVWVIMPAGAVKPDAVAYQGKDGLWLIEADELRQLSRRDGWSGWTYDVYAFTAQALTYRQDDAAAEPKAWRWDDDAAVQELSNISALLEFGNKKPAVLECLDQTYALSKRRSRADSMRDGLALAEKLSPGAVLDPGRLAGLQPELAQAKAKLSGAQADCAAAAQGGPDKVLRLYQARKLREQAEREVFDAEQTFPTLNPPADQ